MTEIALIIILGSASYYWWRYGLPIVVFAIRSGLMKARGRVYLRDMDPFHFWVGLTFHIMGLITPLICLYAVVRPHIIA
jgi:hypothetical protein